MNMNKKLLMSLVLLVIGASMAFAQVDKLSFTNMDRNTAVSVRQANAQVSGSVVIPAVYNGLPVTRIDGNAFGGNRNITSVTIPNSVTFIGDAAFQNCSGLTSLTIPSSVTDLSIRAFSGVNFGMSSITIPATVQRLTGSISGSDKVTSVTFLGSSTNYTGNGELPTKYQAGGAGTYTRSGNVWTKQGGATVTCPTCGQPLP